MSKWILPGLALLFCAMASLTLVRAPGLAGWKIAILAGEYGHFLVLGPLLVLGVVISLKPGGFPCWSAVMLGGLAAVLFLRPVFCAWRIARTLPAEMTAAFPLLAEADRPSQPLDLAALFAGGSARTSAVETRVYSEPGGEKLGLDFYRATAGAKPAPCIVVVHGGGWDGGDRRQLPALYAWLVHRGYAVATIDYRLAPKWRWPAQRDDLTAALAWLKAHAAELGIDPAHLVLLGRSAGTQIAEATAYAAHDPAIRGVIGLYGPADMYFAWQYGTEDDVLHSPQLLRQLLGGAPGQAKANYDSASGYLLAGRGCPPTLLIHGALDTLVWHRQSERLAARLDECGAPHYFLSLPWATHAFDYNLNGPGGQLATYAIGRFLTAVTR